MNNFHTPVLLKEVNEYLKVEKGKKYIDATIGGGGHASEIIKRGGIVLGIDCDQEAIDYIKSNFQFSIFNYQLKLVRGNFREIDRIARLNNFEKVAGILFDLGMSSHQVDEAVRGFSFQKEGPLDMRMDSSPPDGGSLQTVTARDLVNGLTKGELYELFTKLGEEGMAWSVSEHIVRTRRIKPIETTRELALIIESAVGMRKGAKSANARASADKKVFQALRIAVNDELSSLKEALSKGVKLLEKNGRLLVISFHSLEDRIVKQTFTKFGRNGLGKILTKKPITSSIEETNKNMRARSSKLRVFEKN